ncbi:Protein Dom3Z, partial [Papilio xuthus]
PNTKPLVDRPVIENEKFSLFYYASLGSHNLLYGAQIDGMLTTNYPVLNPPEDTNVESNLNYLRNNEYVELKTNRHIDNYRQEHIFRCWCQCYLANLKGLLVGFRIEKGIVQRLQWFHTEDIVEYCQNNWSPQMTIDCLNYFLSYIKNCYTTKNYSYPVSVTFQLNANRTIDVIENPKCEFLSDWYVNNGN